MLEVLGDLRTGESGSESSGSLEVMEPGLPEGQS